MPYKHDWDKLKAEYVEGISDGEGNIRFPTLQDISVRNKVSESTLRKQSANDDWANERNIFRSRLEQKRREQKSELLAGKASAFDGTVFRAAELGLQQIMRYLINGAQQLKDTGGKKLMPMNQLEALGKSLVRYQQVGRLALGETTEITSGEADNGEHYFLIQEIINDPELAERIEENYRHRIGDSVRKEEL